MAKRRRRFSGLVSIPGLSGLKDYNPFGKNGLNSTDVVVGAAIGMVGGMGVKLAIGKIDQMTGGKVPQFVRDYIGPISGFGAGVLAYMVEKKFLKGNKLGFGPSKASAHLVGATIAALVPVGWTLLQKQFPQYAGYVDVNYNGYGMLVDEGSVAGLLVDEPGMAGLASLASPDDVDILDAA